MSSFASRVVGRRRGWMAAALVAAAAVVPWGVRGTPAAAQLRPGWMRRGNPMIPADPSAGDPSATNDRDTPVGVNVPDSPAAAERLDRAAEKEQQHQWSVAADFYREAIDKDPGRVVKVAIDRANKTYLYGGVATVVQERIAKWPKEGLDVYRARFGQAAADKLAAAGRGDLAALEAVFYDDFVTDAGKAAGIRLIDAWTESGNFAAAAAIGDRLLSLHPMLGADRATILFRTGLADHWAGDDAAANARLDELRKSDPKAIGTVAGKDAPLTDALATAIAVPAPVPTVDPAAADTYPSFGGAGGRGDVSPSVARPGASLTTIELTPPDYQGLPQQLRQAMAGQDKSSVDSGACGGIIPAVDAGTLFLQDGRTVYAVDADSGRPAAGWQATYRDDGHGNGGRYHITAPGRARDQQLTVTVTPTNVLAIMGQADPLLNPNGNNDQAMFFAAGRGRAFMMGGDSASSTVRLVCLDRATGREQWSATPGQLPEAAGAARACEYVGTPLAVPGTVAGTPGEDAVLVCARGGKDAQFDDCYVVCLSARTRQFRWSTYVGSGARSLDGETMVEVAPSQLSLADGHAFVMTNLGTVAALDPANGRVAWLSAYPRDNVSTMVDLQNVQMGNVRPPRPWAPNPVVVQAGHVFALPTDAKELFVLDAASGRQLAKVQTADYDSADVLLGVRDQYAVMTADHAIVGVDWRRYDHDHPKAASWVEDSWGGEESPATAIAARGFLTTSGIFVVNHQKLSDVDWRTHKIALTYPAREDFAAGQGPGNVLVTSQNVVIAGPDRVDVYTDLGLVATKYLAEMDRAPTDPEPRVRFANALFTAGRIAEATARMDEAIGLLGGRSAMRTGPGRDLVFGTLLDFARRSAHTTPKPEDRTAALALTTGLFDRAADAADGPDQRSTYLLARARFSADHEDYRATIELAQQVLSDPALRAQSLDDAHVAGGEAASLIATAMGAQPSAYAPVEAEAAAALADARGRKDLGALLAVADAFPNSHAAADARRAAIDRLRADGQPGRAIDLLRQTYALTSDPAAKARLLEEVAATFLSAGPDGVGPAVDRLAWANHLSGDGKLAVDVTGPDGTVFHGGRDTIAAAVDHLRGALATASTAALPDFRLSSLDDAVARYAAAHPDLSRSEFRWSDISPFLPPGSGVIAGVTALVHPTRGFDRTDRVLAWSPAGLAAYGVGQTTPRFTSAAVREAPIGAAWMRDRWVVWTPARVVAVSDDGHDAWPTALAMADLPAVGAVASLGGTVVEDAPTANSGGDLAVNDNNVIVGNVRVRNMGGVVIVNGQRVIVNRAVPVLPNVPALAPAPIDLTADEQVVAAQPAMSPVDGGGAGLLIVSTTRGRVLGIDAATGTLRWQSRPVDRAADALLANGHFAVVRLDDPGGSMLVVYDALSGRVVGRRRFASDGTPGQLVNAALGEEGTLVVSMTTTVEVIDLYDPWSAKSSLPLVARSMIDPTTFTGLSQPDQLLASAGRIVALYDGGKWLRAWDSARPAVATDPGAGPAMAGNPLSVQLALSLSSANVSLRLDGPRLFVVQPTNVIQYNLADPADQITEDHPDVNGSWPHVRGLELGRDYALVIHDPVDHGPAPSTTLMLIAMNRALVPGTNRTSGNWDYQYAIHPSSGVADLAGVDGGVYFLTGDHRLVYAPGGRGVPVR